MKNLKKLVALLVMVSLVGAMFTGCKSDKKTEEKEKKEIVVLAAASLTDVTAKLKEAYEKEHSDVTITFSYGSSGALMTQIEEGAPADIFMSAALRQMNELNEKEFMNSDSIVNLLENKVVLITYKDNKNSISSFDALTNDSVKMIALGEPGSVPVGQYSEEIFKSLNILDKVTKKAVYGSDVRGVLSYVESQNADYGVVYATDAKTSDNVKVVCEAPSGSCKQVIYPVGVLKNSKVSDEAKAFITYLQSDEAMKMFEEYGFSSAKGVN